MPHVEHLVAVPALCTVQEEQSQSDTMAFAAVLVTLYTCHSPSHDHAGCCGEKDGADTSSPFMLTPSP